MKNHKHVSLLARLQRGGVLGLVALAAPIVHSQTLWTGPTTNFTQSGGNSDVLLPGKVALGRGQNGPLYNSVTEDGSNFSTSPADTMWAFGSLSNYSTLNYVSFASLRNGDLAGVLLPNKPMVVHLVNENIYLALTFTAWGQHFAGGFAYTRSTPAAVAPTPTISITNPAGGAIYAAPANVKLGASASVTSGTVTNVQFFANGSPVGSVTTAPFNVTSSALGAGAYQLTAVAKAAGVSATSSVVNITVVTPTPLSLSSPAVSGGEFLFNYSVNPGLKYLVQTSPDLTNWTSVATNLATVNPATYSNAFNESAKLYYRAALLPNP